MVVDVAELKEEEQGIFKDMTTVSEHLTKIRKLILEVEAGMPEVVGEPVKVGKTQFKTPGRIGELAAHLTEFHHYAERVFRGGLLFVRTAEEK